MEEARYSILTGFHRKYISMSIYSWTKVAAPGFILRMSNLDKNGSSCYDSPSYPGAGPGYSEWSEYREIKSDLNVYPSMTWSMLKPRS